MSPSSYQKSVENLWHFDTATHAKRVALTAKITLQRPNPKGMGTTRVSLGFEGLKFRRNGKENGKYYSGFRVLRT